MIRYRSSLLLVAIAALLISGTPVSAGSADVAAVLWPDAGRCAAPASPAVNLPILSGEAAIPQSDFILCTCHFCADHKGVYCQISPSGYTILCLDYYQSHCSG